MKFLLVLTAVTLVVFLHTIPKSGTSSARPAGGWTNRAASAPDAHGPLPLYARDRGDWTNREIQTIGSNLGFGAYGTVQASIPTIR